MITKVFWGLVSVLFVVIVALYFVIESRSETVRAINGLVQAGNTGLPRQVDEYTVLESVYSKRLRIYFQYSIKEYERYSEKAHRDSVLEMFRSLVCETPKFHEKLLEKGVEFNFLYKSTGSSNRIFTFGILDCE